jgi:hypothetical protein
VKPEQTRQAITSLEQSIADAAAAIAASPDAAPETLALRDLQLRARKLARAWGRPQSLGFFGPSQAGKSFLVGALLQHELGSLRVLSGSRELDFLKEINPAKGVESTGVVTRFSSGPAPRALKKGDFHCRLLTLDLVLESLATGFLVECTSPTLDAERIERCFRDAKLQAGPPASAAYQDAWDTVWHGLVKKYQDRHPYLNELRRQPAIQSGAWKKELKTTGAWLMAYSLLWGGPGYSVDLDRLLYLLVQGLDAVGHVEDLEVSLDLVRAASDGASIIDAACLNSLGSGRAVVHAFAPDTNRDVAVEPGILSALIAEIRLPLRPVPGSLLDHTDILDFPGGRALKGINGFGPAELNTGKLENAIEVYKRGKLTFLFEQFSIDREITALCLCSPGPTKPEAIQMQSQVESWLTIRHGASTPQTSQEIDRPSLFMALTKFDMSLGALRSDNAKDRWDSRVQEACVEFWARGHSSWVNNWGAKGKPFANMFWIRNPYADQMQSLKPGEPDYEIVKAGYQQSRAVTRYIEKPDEKWSAVEGTDADGLPRSGVPLLASRFREKLAEDIKGRELRAEAKAIRAELMALLKALTPSKDEAEERQRRVEAAQALVDAVRVEMHRRYSGAVFGDMVHQLVVPLDDLEREVRKVHDVVAPMQIKASDKVKKVLVHVLKWWWTTASERFRTSELQLPGAAVEAFLREICTSKSLMPVLGNAVFPYFSRTTVDTGLVATILQVKICDAMLDLFVDRARRTPSIPARLSYSEEVGDEAGERASKIDWSDVSFDDDEGATKKEQVEIVFAGNRYFNHWAAHLADFYVQNGGGQKMAPEDPRTKALVSVLQRVETVDVPAG